MEGFEVLYQLYNNIVLLPILILMLAAVTLLPAQLLAITLTLYSWLYRKGSWMVVLEVKKTDSLSSEGETLTV